MEAYFEQRLNDGDYAEIINQFTDQDLVISVSLFTCENAYNEFAKYVDGLQILIKAIRKVYPEAKFLVFYDVMSDKLKELESDVIFCKFDFPDYRSGTHHIGMFGTLMRYLPMFLTDFKYKYLYVMDCDVVNRFIPPIKVNTLRSFIKTGESLHILTIPSAPLNPRYEGMNTGLKTWLRIIGEGFIIKEMKFPISILYDFLHSYLVSEEYEEQCRIIFTENIKYEYKLKPSHGKFMYGVDEFMLVFLMQYIENNNIPLRYTLCPYHYKLPFYYWLEKEATDEMKREVKEKLGCDLMTFVGRYKYTQRGIMFKVLLSKVDVPRLFSPMLCDCIDREYKTLDFVYSVKY